MCKDAGIKGENLHHLQLAGVSLTGEDAHTKLFAHHPQKPAMSVPQLMKSSKWSRNMVLKKKKEQVGEAVLQAVWDTTLGEVEKGWLQGPLNEQQVKQRLGPLFVASKRLGLEQADKIRQIDNMSESLVNASFGASYKLDLDGVDGISVMARTFAEATQNDRTVRVQMRDGCWKVGKLHESFSVFSARSLSGRTLDLDAAYKQVLVAKSSLWCNVLGVDDPGGERRLFISQVLPFGASASVYGFNKIVRAIHRVGTSLFGLVWSNYYEDFPQLDLQCCGDWAQDMAEQYLELIGWVFSTKPTKRLKMSNVFSALGVTFDLRASADGMIRVANKESRVSQLLETIESLLLSGTMTEAEAATLRGGLQFAESQTCGRAVSLHMREVGQRSVGKKAGKHLIAGMVEELRCAKEFLQNHTPRLLQAHTSERKLVIFTDSALESEDEVGSLGLVAFWIEQGKICQRYFLSLKSSHSTSCFSFRRRPRK